MPVDLDEGAKAPAQAVHDHSKIAGRLGLRVLVPQQPGQRLARLRLAGAGQIDEQGLGPARHQARDGTATQTERKTAQGADDETGG